MSTARDDLQSWNRRRWGAMVAALALGQLALILTLAEREFLPSESLTPDRTLRAVGWPVDVADSTRQLGVSDPVLFALPTPWGFSGEAWRLASTPSPPRLEWTEPVRWLAGDSQWFGRNPPILGTALLSPKRPLLSPVPSVTPLRIHPLPVARTTRLELDEFLQTRGLSARPEFPAITHTNLLDATVLQVAVEPDGAVFSIVVLKSSGWQVADQRALDLVRQLKFTSLTEFPQPSKDCQWGRVKVRWCVAPPVSGPDQPNPSPAT